MNSAYAYFYDEFLNDRRFEREISRLEAELARRGIEGRVARTALFRHAKDQAQDLVRGGAKNLILVGDDRTLEKLMWFLPDLDVTIGFIPIAKSSKIADWLSIPIGVPSVDVIGARFVETIDIGRFADRYFLTEAILPATDAVLDVEGKYKIQPAAGGSIRIKNLAEGANPKDGLLEAVVTVDPPKSRWSLGRKEQPETRIILSKGSITSSQPVDAVVDGQVLNGFSFQIEALPARLRVITGRRGR